MSLVIEQKYDRVRQLINIGKERGYPLYDEVKDILPAEVRSQHRRMLRTQFGETEESHPEASRRGVAKLK